MLRSQDCRFVFLMNPETSEIRDVIIDITAH